MKNTVLTKISVLTFATALLTAFPAAAATLSFDLKIDNLSGGLVGNTFSGTFSLDDASLTGTGDESTPVTALDFNFLDNDFSLAEAAAPPEALFLDNQLLGLSYAVGEPGTDDVSFAFVPGFFSPDEAFFAYDNEREGAGFGDVRFTQVPEPATALGSAILMGGLIFWGRRKRRSRRIPTIS